MLEFSMRDKSMLLVMVTQWLAKLHKGRFQEHEILNLSEWLLYLIDYARENPDEFKNESMFPYNKKYELYVGRGMLSLYEYVYYMLIDRTAKELHKIADDWCENEQFGKYFGIV